ncbi:MAG: helix-turn-helix domain-containing protein [bacterium]|nr:helix-turn-helix domain-containing protein [bacterium]
MIMATGTARRFVGRCVLAVLAAIIIGSPLWGLDPAINANDYLMDKWTIKDGLPTNKVRCIVQTPDNYLWIGTFAGLVRFDGVRMLKIASGDEARTGDSYITKLHVDRQGALWIGTYFGLTRYKDNRFTYFSLADGLPKKPILSICEDANGMLLVSSHNDCIYRFNAKKNTFERFDSAGNFEKKQVIKIFQDSKGILWFSSLVNGLYKYINDSFVKVAVDIPGGVTSTGYIHENHNGDLFVATLKGLALINTDKTVLFTPANCGLSNIKVGWILEDKNQILWLATKNGLNRMTVNNAGKKQVQVILEKEDILTIFEDRDNNLWIGTEDSGLIRLKNPLIKTYTTADGLPDNHINCLLEDRSGTIWIGTETRLCRFRNSIFESVPTDSLSQWFGLAEDKDGNLWACGSNGLLKNPGPNAVPILRQDNKSNRKLSNIFFDSKNRLWTGSHQGIQLYENNRFKSFTTAEGMPHDFGSCITEDQNHDILVLTSNGLIRFPNGELTMTGAKTYLPGVTGSFILKDKDNPGVLWLGSYLDGLLRFSGEKGFSFKNVPGLEDKQLYQGLEDEYGCLWLGSDKGIIRLKKKDLEDYAAGKGDWLTPTVFTTKDGMLKLNCAYSANNSILKTSGGKFWFATNKGICIIDPAKIIIDKHPPNVIIEAVTVDKKRSLVSQKILSLKDIKEIAFRFTAPTFISPGSTHFKYRLEGLEEKWQTLPLRERRKIVYHSLSPGSYRFRVIAGNRFGIWNTTGASTAFEILPPFYATFWFWTIILLLAAAGIGGGLMWFKKSYIRKPTPASSYENTKPDPVESKKALRKLTHLMEMEKIYRDDNLSSKILAEKLHVSVHFLSRLLNEHMGNSFYELVNGYRIEEVKARLSDPAEADMPILNIAYDAGFSTKSSFNRYFRKITGLTPSQFRKNQEPA